MDKRYMQPLRIAIQWGFLLFSLYLGVTFYLFVIHVRSGGEIPFVARPDGIEAFLPISALLSLKELLITGEINPVHPAGLVIFLIILTSSLLLKRSFCSWVCPVGTVSELFWKSGFRIFRRNLHPPRWLDAMLRGIKYLLLFFFLYTIMWRMSPLEISAFINSDYNKLADVRLLDFFLHISLTGLATIGILILMSIAFRNPFCRFLCPYGALLGLISTLSPMKVTRITDRCISCGVCNQVCPSAIKVMSKKRVFSPECFGCWRCISHCRAAGALEMRLTGRKIAVNGFLFAILVVVLFWGGSLVAKSAGMWHTSTNYEEYRFLIKKRD